MRPEAVVLAQVHDLALDLGLGILLPLLRAILALPGLLMLGDEHSTVPRFSLGASRWRSGGHDREAQRARRLRLAQVEGQEAHPGLGNPLRGR